MHVKDLLSLDGKVAMVTGGAGLYGKSIAEGLAEAGAKVIIASRGLAEVERVAADFQRRGLDVQPMRVDQAETASVRKLKDEIVSRFGRLNAFINNAVARPMKGYHGSIEQFAESMRVNATGMMLILREMSDLIVSGGGGSVVNISSMMGMFGPDLSNYEGTDMGEPPPDYYFHRAGIIQLTRYMARIYTGKNITFNCISPGGLLNDQPQRFLENYCSKVPVGRMANNDDIKSLVVLLSSPGGAYINGTNILMDGGLNA